MSAISSLLQWHRTSNPPYLADMFPEQRAFFDDPAKMKAAVSGRRAGKTVVDAAGLYDAAAAVPNAQCPYITLSSVMAHRIMWPVLVWFNERYSLGMKMSEHHLTAHLPNGSSIFLVGGDDSRKVEALRGAPYPRAVIDEAGSFPRALLKYLIDDVLDAALMDYDGDLWITGTPNAACIGYFHDLTTGKNPDVTKIATHHWTMLENRHLPHAKEWLERKRRDKGWSLDHPVYQREYLGRWIRNTDSMVFRFNRLKHLVDSVPDIIRGNIGVDLGVSDNQPTTAMVASGWVKNDRRVYTVHAQKFPSMTPSSSAEEIGRLRARMPWVSHVVTDAGGLGKGYVEEWRRRWQMPAIPAEKKNKLAYVELLNGELDLGNVLLLDGKTKELVEELELLQWNEDRDGYDERFADHAADAWLYGWRDCYSWAEKMKPPPGPEPGTKAFWDAQQASEKEEARKQAAKRERLRFRNGWRPQ